MIGTVNTYEIHWKIYSIISLIIKKEFHLKILKFLVSNWSKKEKPMYRAELKLYVFHNYQIRFPLATITKEISRKISNEGFSFFVMNLCYASKDWITENRPFFQNKMAISFLVGNWNFRIYRVGLWLPYIF